MKASPAYSALTNKAWLSWKLPLIVLGLALIALIWGVAWLQIVSERRAMVQSLKQETRNLALIFEQNTERTSSEIDRIIKYLRSTYERQGFWADWPTLVMEEFTASRRTVQIAVMDKAGMMITSSKLLRPKNPVDLSDREHFRVHADAGQYTDRLFISKPVLGRASNKWSVQFTRPYADANGLFAGVIVVSLDPSFLTRNFAELNLGADGGLAIIGEDGIVRAGAGRFETSFGEAIDKEIIAPTEHVESDDAFTRLALVGGAPRVTVVRKLKYFPLRAVIARTDAPMFATWRTNGKKYLWGASALTLAIAIALIISIARRRSYERQLSHMARYDALTNLLNRREFSGFLNRRLNADGRKSRFNLLLLDLDDFKRVNDTYGHPIGDQLLVAAAQRICRNVEERDVVARLGGDEFAIIQLGAPEGEEVSALAESLCRALATPYTIEGKRIEVSVSIGIVTNCHDFGDEDDLMRSADLALYASKNAGGHTFRLYDEQMNREAAIRRETETGLRDAIARGHLEVHYQPIFQVKTSEMTSVEALIRWRHPEKGMISPGVFIPVAEQSGLIVTIGAWVMEHACIEIASRSPDLTVAVNVSPIEFRDGDVYGSVQHAIAASGIDPHRLKVEITESTLMSKDRATLEQLDRIRALGVRISMDDFGTGYSSLSYLQSYPIDCLKIDQSFVRGLGGNAHAPAIIEAIVRLAQAMGIPAVAEGVETEEQLTHLRQIGCTEAQGYLLGRPKPIDEILPADPAGEGAEAKDGKTGERSPDRDTVTPGKKRQAA